MILFVEHGCVGLHGVGVVVTMGLNSLLSWFTGLINSLLFLGFWLFVDYIVVSCNYIAMYLGINYKKGNYIT